MTQVKFCGITNLEDAQRAADLGAWAIGLIFWPGSRRRCSFPAAAEIAAALRRRVEVVGVFVNPSLDDLTRRAEDVGLTMLQLHGDEGPAFCAEAARRTGCRVIKAVRVRSRAEIQGLASFHTDFHLLDSYAPGHPGGTGEVFAWELARGHRGPVPLILSGGLRPENVAEAISVVGPYAVDVASGVEREPGVKDPGKLEAFMQEVGKAGPHAAPPGRVHAPVRRSAHARTGTSS
ncbi:MAG TPA: phosphoribosylanthranilate isomerase [Solirubrobacteraceae bacterium]|nr:phosphoribosylanthranilate isomerase [Solirubrobacteraceae bacterium]